MNIFSSLILLTLLLSPLSSFGQAQPALATEQISWKTTSSTIAFGSCLRHWKDQPIWRSVLELEPEAFIFLGDNIYSDRGKYIFLPLPGRIQLAYKDLEEKPEYQNFISQANLQGTAIYATWDDHDYGVNDGGEEFPYKLEAKKYFMEFFGLTETASGGSDQAGIYQSHFLDIQGKRIQLVLLDTRSFRSPLNIVNKHPSCTEKKIMPNTSPGATVLGEQQWQWLERTLDQEADLYLIASSIQVIPEEHCFEKWANYPQERERLLNLIQKNQARVVLLSGDRHLAEISKLPAPQGGYPIYEITASGLNSAMGGFKSGTNEENQYRATPRNFTKDNMGTITFTDTSNGTLLGLQIRNRKGKVVREINVDFETLAPITPGN